MTDQIPSPQQQITLWITLGRDKHIQLQRSSALDHCSHQNLSWRYLKSKLIWFFTCTCRIQKRGGGTSRRRDDPTNVSGSCDKIAFLYNASVSWETMGFHTNASGSREKMVLVRRTGCSAVCTYLLWSWIFSWLYFLLCCRFDIWCRALTLRDAENSWEEILPPIDVFMVRLLKMIRKLGTDNVQ